MELRIRHAFVLAGATALASFVWWQVRSHAPEPAAPDVARTESALPAEGSVTGTSAPARPLVCTHPYIPTARGTELTYAIRTETDGRVSSGAMFLEAIEVSALGVETTWVVDVSLEASAPLRTTARPRCLLGLGAEDPWTHPSMGLFEERGERWLWPPELEPGSEFGGSVELVAPAAGASVPPASMAVSRTHRVVGEEEVRVAAGPFQAWRVDFDEVSVVGDRTFESTGTTWIAVGIGMVRSEIRSSTGTITSWELSRYEVP